MSALHGLLLRTAQGWSLLFEQKGVLVHKEVETTGISASMEEDLLPVLQQSLPQGSSLALVVQSVHVLNVPTTETPGHSRRSLQELLYDIEYMVPWSAEDMVATVVDESAIVMPIQPWESCFTHLRAAGYEIGLCLPYGWIHGQGLFDHLKLDAQHSLLFQNPEGIHMFQFRNQQQLGWQHWPRIDDNPTSSENLAIAAEISARLQPHEKILAVDLPAELLQVLRDRKWDVDVMTVDIPHDQLLWEGMQSCGKEAGTMNLVIGPLEGNERQKKFVQSIRVCCWTTVLCCIALCGLLITQGWKLNQLSQDSIREQAELFRETFPGMLVPQMIMGRFESEHRKAMGQRGSHASLEFPQPAISALRSLLQGHAHPIRSRFEEIVIRNGLVEVESEFRNHEEAAAMIKHLEEAGLTISPPQFQKIDDQRIGIRLRGALTTGKGTQ